MELADFGYYNYVGYNLNIDNFCLSYILSSSLNFTFAILNIGTSPYLPESSQNRPHFQEILKWRFSICCAEESEV